MNRREQKALLKAIGKNVIDNLVRHVERGNVPETWDGHELRELLHDVFTYERTTAMRDKRSQRVRDYTSALANSSLFNTAPPKPLTPAKQLVQRFERASQ